MSAFQPVSLLDSTDFENIRDVNGRRIMPGDLIKLFHFRAAHRRRNCFLYHYVIRSDKDWNVATGPYLRACHMEELRHGKPLTAEHGFRLLGNEHGCEIIDGPSFQALDGRLICWYERPKKKEVQS